MSSSCRRPSRCCSGPSDRAGAAVRVASPALPALVTGLRLRAAPRARGRAASRGGAGSAMRSDTG
eukprot:12903284-Alexandrium_andersonii.AAC.1